MNTAQFLLIFNSVFIMICVWIISNSDCLDEATNILYSVKEKFDYKIPTTFSTKGTFVLQFLELKRKFFLNLHTNNLDIDRFGKNYQNALLRSNMI